MVGLRELSADKKDKVDALNEDLMLKHVSKISKKVTSIRFMEVSSSTI